jgi:hypothetical protein
VIDDVPVNRLGNRIELHTLGLVDGIEQRRERMTQVEATPTPVANIEYALELFEERGLVVELVTFPIEGMASGSLKAPLAIVGHRGF